MMKNAILAVTVLLALSACGKKGDVKPPASANTAAVTLIG